MLAKASLPTVWATLRWAASASAMVMERCEMPASGE